MVRGAVGAVRWALHVSLTAGLLLSALSNSCGPRGDDAPSVSQESEHARPSMPDSMKVPMDSMPDGPSPDSMAAQMERAFQEGAR